MKWASVVTRFKFITTSDQVVCVEHCRSYETGKSTCEVFLVIGNQRIHKTIFFSDWDCSITGTEAVRLAITQFEKVDLHAVCQGCYRSPCECLSNDCDCDPPSTPWECGS